MNLPLLGLLALLGRITALGVERPVFKALAKDRDSVVATCLAYALAVLLLLPFVLTGVLGAEPFSNLSAWLGLALVSGTVAAAGYNLYTLALGRGDVSILAPLYSSGLLFIYALELAFGAAVFSWLALAGILLVVAGLSLLSTEDAGGLRHFLQPLAIIRKPGALPMVLAALLLAVVRVIDKSASGLASEGGYALIATLPTVAIGLVVVAARRQLRELPKLAVERPAAAIGSAASHIGGYLILLVAYRYFNASVIEPVGQLAVFVNIALGWLWFKEPVARRWLPAAMIALGAALVLVAR